jgi:hypothetical protein
MGDESSPENYESIIDCYLFVDICLVALSFDRLCCLVVKFLAAKTEVPGSIPGAIRFSE